MYNRFFNEIKNREKIITNTDLDGILSASLLCKCFPHLELSGFSNSSTNIWFKKDVTKENSLYIDIFMTNKNTFCIDNHIINTCDYPIESNLKINPNLLRNITLDKYTKKYPFSTFIFILNILENYMEINFIDLEKIIGYVNDEPLYLWELILRADDTLLNSFRYKNNTNEWWDYLISDNSIMLKKLKEKVKDVNSISKAMYIKEKVQKFLLDNFNIKTDGFKYINNSNFNKFVTFVSESLGCKLLIPNDLNNIEVKLYRHDFSNEDIFDLNKIFEKYNIISLSFVSRFMLSFSFLEKS